MTVLSLQSIPPPPCSDPWILAPASPASLAVLESDRSKLQAQVIAVQSVSIYRSNDGGIPPLISTVCRGAWDRSPWSSSRSHKTVVQPEDLRRGLPRDMEEWQAWQESDGPVKRLRMDEAPAAVPTSSSDGPGTARIKSISTPSSRQSTLLQGSFGVRSGKPGVATSVKKGSTGGVGSARSSEGKGPGPRDEGGAQREEVLYEMGSVQFDATSSPGLWAEKSGMSAVGHGQVPLNLTSKHAGPPLPAPSFDEASEVRTSTPRR